MKIYSKGALKFVHRVIAIERTKSSIKSAVEYQMEEPKIEDVLKNIHDLYVNPDTDAKERASKWLEQFQKSVSACNLLDSCTDFFF